jgi:eukaryotic-like serine/threonine-protein kinase
MFPQAGMQLSQYRFERLIGRGGMAQVWAARHQETGKEVAIKVLRGGARLDDLWRARFLREVYASRRIAHPAIVPALDVLDDADGTALVMDLLRGETLRNRLDREGRLSVGQTARLLLPAVEAVQAAHALGIVHRDLKPDNIFIEDIGDGKVATRLLDFGVARFHEPPPGTENAPSTALGAVVGTLAYMAPEQALEPSLCDAAVDIWALGVVMYEALGGCRPIDGETGPEALHQLLVGAITPLEIFAPRLPAALTSLVASMLTRVREKRLPDLGSAARILAGYVETTQKYAPEEGSGP